MPNADARTASLNSIRPVSKPVVTSIAWSPAFSFWKLLLPAIAYVSREWPKTYSISPDLSERKVSASVKSRLAAAGESDARK
jgi:hypothetical protein